MKKLLILLLIIFTIDSFASGIASNSASAPCTNNTLETYSGNSNLAADWQPNTIQLRWYDNNTLLNVQSAANTCVYDGALTIPQTAPSRTGYTFAGWEVRPQMDFSTIPTNDNGLERWSIGWYNNANYCLYSNSQNSDLRNCSEYSMYEKLQTFEWAVVFEHGNLYGMSMCSSSYNNTQYTTGVPSTTNGDYCWCKATGYESNTDNILKRPSQTLPWVYSWAESVGDCPRACPTHCAYGAVFSRTARILLFTPVGN